MSEVYIGINPIYDSIYGEADAQGLIDKMVDYQHQKDEDTTVYDDITWFVKKNEKGLELAESLGDRFEKITLFFIYLIFYYTKNTAYGLDPAVMKRLSVITLSYGMAPPPSNGKYLNHRMMILVLTSLLSNEDEYRTSKPSYIWPSTMWVENPIGVMGNFNKLYPNMAGNMRGSYFMNWVNENPFS
jgi:hypothetical protein